jgi:phosphoglycolate phosphatase
MTTDYSRYSHIIWDWNGTLLDDKWLCIESINVLLTKRHLEPIDEEKYNRIFRFPVRKYYEEAGFDFSREPFEVPALEFIRLYDDRKKECGLQQGAGAILDYFARQGKKQYILSASETTVLEEMTSHFGIAGYFSLIKGLDNHYAHGKGDLGLELLAEIGADPLSVLLIGDTCHDKEVADLMGIDAILCSHGHFSKERLMGCDTSVVPDLIELSTLFSGTQSLH